MSRYLAIDLGGTYIKYTVFDDTYRTYTNDSFPTPSIPESFLKNVLELVEQMNQAHGIKGIAISSAGFINVRTGDNKDFSIGENFTTYNLLSEIKKKYDLPVVIENDSNCAAIGEQVTGLGKRYQDYCLLTIGTDIGGAVVLNGALHRGSHYRAGEAGLTLIKKPGGSWEKAGGTSRLVKRVSQEIHQEIDGYYVFRHLNDDRVQRVYREWLEGVAAVVVNVILMIDPQAILIGGGISAQEQFIEDLRGKVFTLCPNLEGEVVIRACQSGNDAGRIGALKLLLDADCQRCTRPEPSPPASFNTSSTDT